jgi:hypothetical protein
VTIYLIAKMTTSEIVPSNHVIYSIAMPLLVLNMNVEIR